MSALRLTSAFDPERIALIRAIEADGWTGRISKQGHAILRAPDGVTTCSIAPKVGSYRGRGNAEAVWKRWKREQDTIREPIAVQQVVAEALDLADAFGYNPRPTPVDTAPEPIVPDEPAPARLPCTDCDKAFGTLQALSVHRVRAHTKVPCPICDRQMSPGNLPRHRATHDHEFGSADQLLRALYQARAALVEARREAASWESLADEAEDRYAALKAMNERAVAALLGD